MKPVPMGVYLSRSAAEKAKKIQCVTAFISHKNVKKIAPSPSQSGGALVHTPRAIGFALWCFSGFSGRSSQRPRR